MTDAKSGALDSIRRMLAAEATSKGSILYAENWVYAPAIQKEREVIEKTEAQILWLHGEEAHSGSHAQAYGHWRLNGGGAMIGKGMLTASGALSEESRSAHSARHTDPPQDRAGAYPFAHPSRRFPGQRAPADGISRRRGFRDDPRDLRGRHPQLARIL